MSETADEFSFMGRTELLRRYREAYQSANGRAADAVMYHLGRYEVRAGTTQTRMRRKDFINALLTLERRGGKMEAING
jgi:hypothetical protein